MFIELFQQLGYKVSTHLKARFARLAAAREKRDALKATPRACVWWKYLKRYAIAETGGLLLLHLVLLFTPGHNCVHGQHTAET